MFQLIQVFKKDKLILLLVQEEVEHLEQSAGTPGTFPAQCESLDVFRQECAASLGLSFIFRIGYAYSVFAHCVLLLRSSHII